VTKDNNHIARLLPMLDVNSHPDSSLHIGHAMAKEYEHWVNTIRALKC